LSKSGHWRLTGSAFAERTTPVCWSLDGAAQLLLRTSLLLPVSISFCR